MYSRMYRFMDMAEAIDKLVEVYGVPGDDPVEYADILSHEAVALFSRGYLEKAVELGMEISSILEQFGYNMLFIKMNTPMLMALIGMGRADEALRLLEENARWAKHSPEFRVSEKLMAALAYAVLGDRGRVEEFCAGGFEVCRPGEFIGGEECLSWEMLRAWMEGRCGGIRGLARDSLGLASLASRLEETCRPAG